MIALIGLTAWCAGSPQGVAQSQDENDRGRAAVTPAGVQRFARGRWTALSVVATNPSEQDRQETVSVYLDGDPTRQYSRRMWVPAGSRRQAWLPVRVPDTPRGEDRIDVSMIRLLQGGDGESFAENQLSMPVSSRSLMLTDGEVNTGLVLDPTRPDGQQADVAGDAAATLIDLGREYAVDSDLGLPTIRFTSNFIPPSDRALDALDQLVVAGDGLLSDTAGIQVVHHWLRRGGRLWIMLDRTDPRLVDQLIGAAGTFAEVDRVELNEFRLQRRDPIRGWVEPNDAGWNSELPVTLLRGFPEADEVAYRIDGWPAAFWKRVGQGEVLLTTLGAQGWMEDQQRVTPAFQRLCLRFFEPRESDTLPVEAMVPALRASIGYSIPSRTLAVAILAANALILLVAGGYWTRRRKLEHLAWLIPVASLVSTGVMMGLGRYHAHAVPSTVATAQIVRVGEEGREAHVGTMHAVYSQRATELPLPADHVEVTLPLTEDARSETRRVLWNDSGGHRWVGLRQPPGVIRHFRSSQATVSEQPIQVRGSFDQAGFRGTLVGMTAEQCEDVIVAFGAAPRLAASLTPAIEPTTGAGSTVTDPPSRPAARVTAAAEAVLPPSQFVPGTLLTDRQRRRQTMLRSLFERADQHALAPVPSLLAWTPPVATGVEFGQQFSRRGAALMSIPIDLRPPATGETFTIPATFLRPEPFAGSRGVSSLFDARTGKWLTEVTKPTETELLFRLPEATEGMRLERAEVRIKVNAPYREVRLVTERAGTRHTVFRRKSPSGLLTFSIAGDQLEVHPAGGLWMMVKVTPSDRAVELPEPPQRYPDAAEGQAGGSQPSAAEPGAAGEDAAEQGAAGLAPPGIQPRTAPRVIDNTTWQIDSIDVDVTGLIPASAAGDR